MKPIAREESAWPHTATPKAKPAGIYPGWLVVLAACSGVMVSFGSLFVFTFSVFMKPLAAEFGWSREAISRAFGLAALTVAACSPKLGQWLDRYGPRKIILPSMAIFGLAFGSLRWLTPHLLHLYAVFIVMGIVGNGTTQMGYSRAIATWFFSRRGLAFALVVAGVGAGAILWPALAQLLIDAHGWRTAYLVLSCLVLLLGLPLTARYVRERPAAPAAPESPTDGLTTPAGLRSRVFWILVATLFVGSVAVNGAITHLAPLLSDRGLSLERAALAVSAVGGASFVGRLVTGHLLDRFFGPRVALALMAATALGIFLLAGAASTLTAFTAAVLIGLGLGAEADTTPYLLTRYFGLRSFSTLYGFTWTAYAIAGALGPIAMGIVFDATGSYTTYLSIMALLTLAAATLLLLLPAYHEPIVHHH
jgi:MFS family permease